MPFFSDQMRSLKKAVNLGVAVEVDFRNLSVEYFKNSILSVTENSKFKKNALKVSKLFRDKPQKPLELAVWWVEYVIRNPSLEHLKSPTLKMNLLAMKSYDALLVSIAIFFILVYLIYKFLKKILRSNKRKIE